MTSHAARLYALALSLVVFFLLWAVVAARPWAATAPAPDPAVAALAAREQRLREQSAAVQRLVARRWQAYRVALAARQRAIAARTAARSRSAAAPAAAPTPAPAPAPSPAPAPPAVPQVRVVTLPPVTATRSS